MDAGTALDPLDRILRTVDVPVSADLERGYDRPAETVTQAIELGVSGINIEDSVAGVLVQTSGLLAEIARR